MILVTFFIISSTIGNILPLDLGKSQQLQRARLGEAKSPEEFYFIKTKKKGLLENFEKMICFVNAINTSNMSLLSSISWPRGLLPVTKLHQGCTTDSPDIQNRCSLSRHRLVYKQRKRREDDRHGENKNVTGRVEVIVK